MSRFLPGHLSGRLVDSANYALSPREGIDLSLVTGPYVWDDVVKTALAAADVAVVGPYRTPGEDPVLLEAISARENCRQDGIWLVAGADQAIEFVLERFLQVGSRLALQTPGFPRFEIVAATLPGVSISRFKGIDSVPTEANMAVLCSPCNPTTAELDEQSVRSILRSRPNTLFCIDAVFSWYGSWNPTDLTSAFDNVIVLKSYSKIGLAGLRVGYVVAHPDLIGALRAGRSPFSVSALAQSIGLGVERAIGRVDDIRWRLEREADLLRRAWGSRMHREAPVPFYVLEVKGGSSEAAHRLRGCGVTVVDCGKFVGMPNNRLRIAIGQPAENARLIESAQVVGLME